MITGNLKQSLAIYTILKEPNILSCNYYRKSPAELGNIYYPERAIYTILQWLQEISSRAGQLYYPTMITENLQRIWTSDLKSIQWPSWSWSTIVFKGLNRILKSMGGGGGGVGRVCLDDLTSPLVNHNLSHDMRFPTMWYVRLAKPQISLRICAVWSETLLGAWIVYEY